MERLQMDMCRLDQKLTAYLHQQEVEEEEEDAEEVQRRSMAPVPSRQSDECILKLVCDAFPMPFEPMKYKI